MKKENEKLVEIYEKNFQAFKINDEVNILFFLFFLFIFEGCVQFGEIFEYFRQVR